MIISKTPFRISFFGGGTDYPAWYEAEMGAVLSTTINKFIYITCRNLPPFFEMRHRIVWSRIENVWQIDEIWHPAIREGLKALGFDDRFGLDIHYQGDLPARSGMGSSSSFAVGFINALTAMKGLRLSKHELGMMAIDLELHRLAEHVGVQDQMAAAYGGLNHMVFLRSGEIQVEPVVLLKERQKDFQDHLMLFYTGISRCSSALAGNIIATIPKRQSQLRRMREMVDEALAILSGTGPLNAFGELLDESWQLKRSLSDTVTNSTIDGIYDLARRHGAIGGKLLGAGESGFMLFFAPPERHKEIIDALGLLHVPFELHSQGSSIIHYDPDPVVYEDFRMLPVEGQNE